SLNVFAVETYASPATARVKRILTDEVLRGAVKSVENKYDVKCSEPKESEIAWRCLNGPQCGYTVVITCPHYLPNGSPVGGWQISMDGFDDGKTNDVL